MVAPEWIESSLDEFGRGLGLRTLALDAQGAVSLRFENGWRLRFEYGEPFLTVMITMEMEQDETQMTRILAVANPEMERPYVLRAGYLVHTREAVFAVRLAEREVSLVSLEAAFQELWAVAVGLKG